MVFCKPSATITKSGSSGSNGVKQMSPKAADLARVYTYMICQNNVLQAGTGSHHVNFPATSVKSEVERAIYCSQLLENQEVSYGYEMCRMRWRFSTLLINRPNNPQTGARGQNLSFCRATAMLPKNTR